MKRPIGVKGGGVPPRVTVKRTPRTTAPISFTHAGSIAGIPKPTEVRARVTVRGLAG